MHKSILDFATASVAILCHTNTELHGVCNAASSCMPAYTHTYTLCISMEKEECIQVLRDTLIFSPALTKCSFFIQIQNGGRAKPLCCRFHPPYIVSPFYSSCRAFLR